MMGLSKVADAVVSGFASGCLWRLGLLAFFTVLLVVLTVLGLPFMLLGGIGGFMVYIVIATVIGILIWQSRQRRRLAEEAAEALRRKEALAAEYRKRHAEAEAAARVRYEEVEKKIHRKHALEASTARKAERHSRREARREQLRGALRRAMPHKTKPVESSSQDLPQRTDTPPTQPDKWRAWRRHRSP